MTNQNANIINLTVFSVLGYKHLVYSKGFDTDIGLIYLTDIVEPMNYFNDTGLNEIESVSYNKYKLSDYITVPAMALVEAIHIDLLKYKSNNPNYKNVEDLHIVKKDVDNVIQFKKPT